MTSLIDFVVNNYVEISILCLLGLNIIQGMRISKMKKDNHLR